MNQVLQSIVFGPLAFIATVAPVQAQMGPMHDWGYSWGWPMGGLVGLAFFALVIIGLVTVARWLFGSSDRNSSSPRSSALAILEDRYARGEINREEFEQRRRDLAG